MSWWNTYPNNMLSADESWFIGRYPQHVARAFIDVSYNDSDPTSEGWQWRPFHLLVEAAIESFAKRWGDLDDLTFLRVLEQGEGRDRLAAIFAIGHSDLPQAADLLAPFLQSADQLERCAAACCLALKQDERALPVLEEYLLCDPPTNEQGQSVPEADIWYDTYQSRIARRLATWGPASMTPILRKAFLKWWDKREKYGEDPSEYPIHDALLYALGRRGALSALHGVGLPAGRRRLAMIFLSLGYLRADERFPDLHAAMHIYSGNQALRQEVASVFVEHFALSEEESQKTLLSFGEDHQRREGTWCSVDEENEDTEGEDQSST